MRAKKYGFLIGLFSLFFSCEVVFGCLMQYTIEGQVIKGPGINDSAGYLSQLGITIGSSVSYTLNIDLDVAANQVLTNGFSTPILPFNTQDKLYYAHLVGGTVFTADIWQDSYNGIVENNQIVDSGFQYHDLYMLAATGNISLQFSGFNFEPNSWTVGSNFNAYSMRNVIYDGNGNCSSFNFVGQITSVIPAPVPEPSTLLLLSVPIIGAGLFRKKIRRQLEIGSVSLSSRHFI
jgi:hypothetical protein